ncbi:MAG: YeeE/YedE family protein [Bdellovibrionales bacterium]|nr:YeeE/YedE family protein [Bdellovibrionales bacterium]
MKNVLAAFVVGLLFALGLGISGMTQPQKVIGFLDMDAWDPSLIFVMIGAVGIHALFYPLIIKRNKPVLDDKFYIPENKSVTAALVAGAFIFGVGWAIGGFCPGPAIVSLASGQSSAFIFVAMMLLGMTVYYGFAKLFPHEK